MKYVLYGMMYGEWFKLTMPTTLKNARWHRKNQKRFWEKYKIERINNEHQR